MTYFSPTPEATEVNLSCSLPEITLSQVCREYFIIIYNIVATIRTPVQGHGVRAPDSAWSKGPVQKCVPVYQFHCFRGRSGHFMAHAVSKVMCGNLMDPVVEPLIFYSVTAVWLVGW